MNLEMAFEGLATKVRGIATDLTLVLNAQPMKLIQPIGNGFAIPPNGVVLDGHPHWFVFFFFFLFYLLLLVG